MRHPAALEETHGFTPALINSARLGFNREAVINNQVGELNPPPRTGVLCSLTRVCFVNMPGSEVKRLNVDQPLLIPRAAG